MRRTDSLKAQATHLERMYETVSPEEREKLLADVQRVIRKLAADDQPVSLRLRQIGRQLEEDALDDMFENMPV